MLVSDFLGASLKPKEAGAVGNLGVQEVPGRRSWVKPDAVVSCDPEGVKGGRV